MQVENINADFSQSGKISVILQHHKTICFIPFPLYLSLTLSTGSLPSFYLIPVSPGNACWATHIFLHFPSAPWETELPFCVVFIFLCHELCDFPTTLGTLPDSQALNSLFPRNFILLASCIIPNDVLYLCLSWVGIFLTVSPPRFDSIVPSREFHEWASFKSFILLARLFYTLENISIKILSLTN